MIYAAIQTDKTLNDLNKALAGVGIGPFDGKYDAERPMVYAVDLDEPIKTDIGEYGAEDLLDALDEKGFDTTTLRDQLYEKECK